jgi:minor extracellular serine protease Vpr
MNSSASARVILLLLLVLVALTVPTELSAQRFSVPDVSQLALPQPQTTAPVSPLLLRSTGRVNVWVQLADAPLALAKVNARNAGTALTRDVQRAYLKQLHDKHNELASKAASMGAKELGRVSKAHNAVAFSIDASKIPILAAQPGVVAVRPVIDYSMDLSETVPYIGATAVQNQGYTGAGVRVAVLDSGIDYTHFNLGGSGTAGDYTAAYGTSLNDVRNQTVNPALFPTAKVVGGYDFVGEQWPNGPLAPDPNPIPCGLTSFCDGTHGTHVADIIAGHSNDNTHKGVAPGAKLYAVKVCSSVSTSCSGVALLEGMDFALDPNGDGDISDAVDVINMSLGSNYGQIEDDLTLAAENAVQLGVVVVTAAGNAADRPYIVSSPSIGPGVISVADTQVPSAVFFPMIVNSPPSIAGTYRNTATLDWAPVGSGFTGDVAYVGRGCATPLDTYLANPSGKVALIDRGTCSISEKVDRAAHAGAIGVLIGLVAPGDAVSFSLGAGSLFVPSLVIIQSDSNLLKATLLTSAVNVTVHDSQSLKMSLLSYSSRGPSYSFQTIKPEIGAPGGSVSAVAGTGTGQTAFSGTSGATPMIAGSAALLLQAFPSAPPFEIKARLMNNAETQIQTAPNLLPGVLAPATRIGGGEIRVDRALASKTTAFVTGDETAAVSFGYAALTAKQELGKIIRVQNFANTERVYSVTMTFRDPSNPGVAAVTMKVPKTLYVPRHGHSDLAVQITVDPAKLQTWTLNGGSQGGNGALLTSLELNGLITLSDNMDTVHLPWTLLPHRAASVGAASDSVSLHAGTGTLKLRNFAAFGGGVEAFAWTGTSKKIAKQLLPQPGDNFAVVDLGNVGVRLVQISATSYGVQFAINTFGVRSHPNYPAEFDIYIDTNHDGTPDYVLYNAESGGFGATGQNVVNVVNLTTGAGAAYFYTDADLNSSNVIMTAPLSALGMVPNQQFGFSIYAFDNYFTGNLTDAIEGMTFNLAQPRFTAAGTTVVPGNGTSVLQVSSVPGGDVASPSQKGLLLLYRDAQPKQEAQTISVF